MLPKLTLCPATKRDLPINGDRYLTEMGVRQQGWLTTAAALGKMNLWNFFLSTLLNIFLNTSFHKWENRSNHNANVTLACDLCWGKLSFGRSRQKRQHWWILNQMRQLLIMLRKWIYLICYGRDALTIWLIIDVCGWIGLKCLPISNATPVHTWNQNAVLTLSTDGAEPSTVKLTNQN